MRQIFKVWLPPAYDLSKHESMTCTKIKVWLAQGCLFMTCEKQESRTWNNKLNYNSHPKHVLWLAYESECNYIWVWLSQVSYKTDSVFRKKSCRFSVFQNNYLLIFCLPIVLQYGGYDFRKKLNCRSEMLLRNSALSVGRILLVWLEWI